MRTLPMGAALLLVACVSAGDDPPTPSPAQSPTAMPSTRLPRSILDPILADAAQLSGVDTAALVVLRAEAVTWPDAGLGCPRPGVYYPQVLVDGYWVVIEAGGREYDYRGRGAGEFILCEIPRGERRPPSGDGGASDY